MTRSTLIKSFFSFLAVILVSACTGARKLEEHLRANAFEWNPVATADSLQYSSLNNAPLFIEPISLTSRIIPAQDSVHARAGILVPLVIVNYGSSRYDVYGGKGTFNSPMTDSYHSSLKEFLLHDGVITSEDSAASDYRLSMKVTSLSAYTQYRTKVIFVAFYSLMAGESYDSYLAVNSHCIIEYSLTKRGALLAKGTVQADDMNKEKVVARSGEKLLMQSGLARKLANGLNTVMKDCGLQIATKCRETIIKESN